MLDFVLPTSRKFLQLEIRFQVMHIHPNGSFFSVHTPYVLIVLGTYFCTSIHST